MNPRKSILSAGRFVRDRFLYGPREKLVIDWLAHKGDITLRIDYDFLAQDSLAFDLGGYCGQWASDLYSRYECRIYVFEPIVQYADFIRKRFHRNPKVSVFPFGLGPNTEEKLIKVSEDASSTYSKDADTPIHIEEFIAFIQREGITDIDLMKVNTEGGEYDILPYLISTGYIAHIRALQVQFHVYSEADKQRAEAIRRDLEKTHASDYSYAYVWEGWSLKQMAEDSMAG